MNKTILLEEQLFVEETVSQMNIIRDKFLSLWSERKFKLNEEILEFYEKKKR